MDDLELLGGRSRGGLVRAVRIGTALFGSGFILGAVVGVVFKALIDTVIVMGAIAIVLIALARMLLGARRR